MYKRPKLDVNAIRCLIAMDANKKFPEQKGTPALKALIEEDLKKSIRYFYQLQCERKLKEWGTYGLEGYKAFKMMEYLPEELYPNIEEWLDDKEISEIPYGDLSIKRIMHWHKSMDGEPIVHSFSESTIAMGNYIKNGCRNIDDALCQFWVIKAVK